MLKSLKFACNKFIMSKQNYFIPVIVVFLVNSIKQKNLVKPCSIAKLQKFSGVYKTRFLIFSAFTDQLIIF